MESKIYRIKPLFAKSNNLPTIFVATKVIETEKAMYLYGRGTMETRRTGLCMKCGRELTHPVSIELGIGPECGGHHYDWDAIGGYNEGNLERLKNKFKVLVENWKIDSWFPKSVIVETYDSEEEIEVPKDHKIIKRSNEKQTTPKRATMVTYKDSGKNGIKITFPFDRTVLENVKTLSGRRFHNEPNEKYWTCPLSVESVESLISWGFEVDSHIKEFIEKYKVSVSEMDDIEIPGMKIDLMNFQKKGVSFVDHKDGRALIGDEQGTGKTLQALAWLQLHPEKRPAVIVVPASLKLNWEREVKKCISSKNEVQILSGTKPSLPIVGDIIIINYDILPNKYKKGTDKDGRKVMIEKERTGWVDFILDIKPQVVVFDEIQYTKNSKAIRTKGSIKLASRVPHVIGLSGTPIVNRPIEFYNALNMIAPDVFSNFWSFANKYCNAKHTRFGWDFTGSSNAEELNRILVNSIMIRRLKKDVLKELPAKIRSIVPIEISNEKEYQKAENNFIEWVRKNKGTNAAEKASNAEALTRIEVLKQIAVKGKMKMVKEWINDFLDSNGKLVVFAVHKAVINELMKEFKSYNPVKVDGSVTGKKRQEAVDKFQTDESCRLFIGNIKAAGVGLTLTAASSVVTVELGWNPGDHDQADDRIHRIGQEADSINAYYLIANGTIEDDIAKLIDSKRQVIDTVLDGKETETSSLFTELLKKYEK